MANWISSKLKVAENLLQQIDQQAAESLKKNDKPRFDDLVVEKHSPSIKSPKDHLKLKTPEITSLYPKSQNDSTFNNTTIYNDQDRIINTSQLSQKPSSTTTDTDWTQFLGAPSPQSSPMSNRVSAARVLKKDGSLELKRKHKSSTTSSSHVARSSPKTTSALGTKLNKKTSSSSPIDMHNKERYLDGKDVEHKEGSNNLLIPKVDEDIDADTSSNPRLLEDFTPSTNKSFPLESVPEVRYDVKVGEEADGRHQLTSTARRKQDLKLVSQNSVSDNLKKGSFSTTYEDSDSDSDSNSGSSSDSESEREREERRKRREILLAEKAAAEAVEAIRERENKVARLEGEKQSLEKILEERANQQEQEASQLQTTMMETMEAVDLEKQKHNNTRMEVFAQLAKLETANAYLARSLAAAQKKLQVEIDQVVQLRQQIEFKEAAHGELERKISDIHHAGMYSNQLSASKGVKYQCEMLEAECSFVADKIGQLHNKANKLEEDIEMTRKGMEDPTEVEFELNRRLDQLTDHLIQKQAQVEALSSEKATLQFRIEAVSRLLDENKSLNMSSIDLESGQWERLESKLRPMFEDKVRSGRKRIGSLIQQLDAIFLAGAVFLRRNPKVKAWFLFYMVCLHLWVLYILVCNPQTSSSDSKSGAVVSLDSINNTAGI